MTTYSGTDFWKEHTPRWPTVQVRKVAKLGTGHTPSRSESEYWVDCTIPWVTTADLTARVDGGLQPLMETEQHISELGLAKSAAVLHPTDTVMLSRTASIGHSVRIGRPMATTQAFVTWTCGPALEARYLLLVLNALKPEFDRIAYGSTHLTIYFPDIEQLRVPLPPLRVQRAIVDYLAAETARIDALIAKKQRMIELLDERRWTTLDRLAELTMGMRVTSLRRVASFFADGDWIESPYITDSGIRLIQTGNIGRGEFREQGGRFISDFTFRELGCKEVLPGDVLISRLANTVGQACTAPDLGCRMVTSVDVVILRPAPIVSAEFLIRYMSTNRFLSLARLEARGTTMQRLACSQVGDLPVVLPPLAEQDRLIREVEREAPRVATAIQTLSTQIDLLREHRQALITAAVTGELDIPGVAA